MGQSAALKFFRLLSINMFWDISCAGKTTGYICLEQNVPFFFKQWGGINKKKTGRLLEGRIWDEMPIKPIGLDKEFEHNKKNAADQTGCASILVRWEFEKYVHCSSFILTFLQRTHLYSFYKFVTIRFSAWQTKII